MFMGMAKLPVASESWAVYTTPAASKAPVSTKGTDKAPPAQTRTGLKAAVLRRGTTVILAAPDTVPVPQKLLADCSA